jgi:hypothetical protein
MKFFRHRRTFTELLHSPAVVIGIVSFLLMAISLAVNFKLRPFTSDDISWQNALLTWHPFSGKPLYWTPDTWIWKLPLFYVLGNLFDPSRKLIFVEAFLLSAANFAFFYSSFLYFIRKMGYKLSFLTLVPVLWLFSFGSSFTNLLLNPNLRNVEIGITFFILMLAAKVYYGELQPFRSWVSRSLWLLISILSGLLIYSDPYFLYFTIVPIALLSIALYLRKSRQDKPFVLTILGGCLIACVVYVIAGKIGAAAGIYIIHQQLNFTSYENIFKQIALAMRAVLVLFSADFSGQPVFKLSTIITLLNTGILLTIIGRLIHAVRTNPVVAAAKQPKDTWVWEYFFGLTIIFMWIVYILSNLAVDLLTYRYLILVPYFAVFLLVALMNNLPKDGRILLAGLLILSSLANIGSSINALRLPQETTNHGNFQDYALADGLKAQHLGKGYSQYWQANIISYFSNGELNLLPAVCTGTKTVRFDWLVDSSRFNTPSATSYLVRDGANKRTTSQCSSENLRKQLGKPAKILTIGTDEIYLYNYDISSRLPDWKPPS